MALNSFLVAPYTSGLETNVEPWLLPEDAYATLQDAYVWRGRVKKRYGTATLGASDLTSRLRYTLTTTDGGGNVAAQALPFDAAVGMQFSIGTQVFTVNDVTVAAATPLLSTGAGTGTIDTTVSPTQVSFTTSELTTAVYFYPALPVMGILTRETSAINDDPPIAFDTRFSYIRASGAWERLDTGTTWGGSDSNFFWGTNYVGANPFVKNLYVVNNFAGTSTMTADNIKYIASGGTTWTNLIPQLNTAANRFLDTARIIIGFQDRLVVFNTVESDMGTQNSYPNRARYSASTLTTDPTTATNWNDVPGTLGGYIDAPTSQAIISCERIKNRLVVYFERSTWELVFTGNISLPFRWQQLNSELGAESTFSIIGFDQAALGVGQVGIHNCDGVNVSRIDEKIPDTVFQVHNENDGVERVYGIRDYYTEIVLWTFPSFVENPTYPNQILVYNYVAKTWALWKDTITAWGYLPKDQDLTWDTVGETYPTWDEWNDPWDSSTAQADFPLLIGGNQQGWTLQFDAGLTGNGQSLTITDMTAPTTITSVNHNLSAGDYVRVEEAQGVTDLNDQVIVVSEPITANTFVSSEVFTGTYTGGGKLVRIAQPDIRTKQYTPGVPSGQQFRLPYVDLLLATTETGEISADTYLDWSLATSVADSARPGAILGTQTVQTFPAASGLGDPIGTGAIWHRFYPNVLAQFVQLRFYLSDAQLKNNLVNGQALELHGMLLFASPAGRLTP